ncbi:MAG TPA: DNA-protecting protein DprA [Candidatus Galloscillospira excrementavium]|nr:DNA-protecting protein DprA [Candidatus Galloscillospira excrementavium]
MASLKYWIWLTTRSGVGHEAAFRLLEHFGTPESAYFADPGEYELTGLPGQARQALEDKSLDGAERILADCERLGVRVLTFQDAEYPERLRQIPYPPCVLYVKGQLFSFDEELAVAVVGSRRPTPYGVRMAGRLGLDLARRGVLLVSGIAQGIDCTALKGALAGGGRVVSVLGGGVDVHYPPQNRDLYDDVAAVGALISEYPPGTEPEGWHFPVRNRIISGLSLGVAAVEAGEGSGTLITTRLALEQNREVFAFPGPADAPMSRGTNKLIQRGEAKLILSAEDVLSEFALLYPHRLREAEPLSAEDEAERLEAVLEGKTGEKTGEKPPRVEKNRGQSPEKEVDKGQKRAYITLKEGDGAWTDDERDILLALGGRTLHPDELVEATGIPARRVLSALTMLQLRGYVEERPGKRFEALVLLRTD